MLLSMWYRAVVGESDAIKMDRSLEEEDIVEISRFPRMATN